MKRIALLTLFISALFQVSHALTPATALRAAGESAQRSQTGVSNGLMGPKTELRLDTVYVTVKGTRFEGKPARGSAGSTLRMDTVFEVGNAGGNTTPGRYIYVPDSLAPGVEKVLKGYAMIVNDDYHPDPDERVIVQGDTISPVLKERNLGRYDRGLFNYIFIPKGEWSIGATASYGEFDTEDSKLLDLVDNADFSVSAYSIKPYMSYAIRNNLTVGLRFGYTRAKANLGSLNVDFDDDLNFSIEDAGYRNEKYTAALTLRQYIGLARSGRFGIFNEAELAFSSGNSTFRRLYGGQPKTTRTTYMDAHLVFSPGLTVFIMEQVSFDVSFGVFGYSIRNERQRTTTEVAEGEEPVEPETGNRFTSGANFRFNIFNINFGLAVHF